MSPNPNIDTPLLELKKIRKVYPSVVANDEINLTVRRGEIHAILGENGAGKSTLMKIVYGATKPDSGQILWAGNEVKIDNPAAARQLGIGMVFQHFALFESLNVMENIQLSLDSAHSSGNLSDRIVEVSEEYGLPVDPRRMVHSMSVGERQRVEIVRCLLQKPKLLIMDEPTSVLTPQAVIKLFETLRRLASEGCSILYISHKLQEIRDLCHTATVLRAGKVTGVTDPKVQSTQNLARMMIGGELPECRLQPKPPGNTLLELINLNLRSQEPFGTDLKNINLRVRSGEILGIAGVSGNGQKELMAAISGENLLLESGSIRVSGQPVGRKNPAERRKLGLTFVPEERLGRGAVPPMSLADNALLTGSQNGMVRYGVISQIATQNYAQRVIDQFKVMCAGQHALASSLSGGNLQKYIVGRETLLNPKVMVVSQPTWGVDVGASVLIRQALIDLRDSGVAVLVISEELDELYMMCDQLAVIAQGRLSAIKPTHETPVETIGLWMSGQFEDPSNTIP